MRDDRSPGSLRALFLERYNDFRSQLRRRLGSDDLAHDAMQEAFLKVNDLPASSSIQQPAAYLFRVALNIAEDQRRRDSRLLTGVEISEL
ncbi:RNA polymerase sigma factor, partial [Enterobacter sp. DRP3]|nr:RNA polymerase sigma factor [Enterobacter sp. DRP3]